MIDRRHQHPGPKGFLSDQRQAQLEMALQEKAPDGGLWNGRKVGDWLTELMNLFVIKPLKTYTRWRKQFLSDVLTY